MPLPCCKTGTAWIPLVPNSGRAGFELLRAVRELLIIVCLLHRDGVHAPMPDRYQREIDELLIHLEGRLRKESLSSKLSRRLRPYTRGLSSTLAAFLRRPPTEQFMIASMVLVLGAFVFGFFAPRLQFYLGILALFCFLLALGLSIAGRRSPGYQKRWRGRPIDYPAGQTIWDHLRVWFRRRGR